MNLSSFADELIKLGGATVLVKSARMIGPEPPPGMVGNDPHPDPEPDIHPAKADTRMPHSKDVNSHVEAGVQGEVSEAKDPISEQRYNRIYKYL